MSPFFFRSGGGRGERTGVERMEEEEAADS